MEMFSLVLSNIFDPFTLLLPAFGTLLGVFVGAIPGLNGAIGVALLVPFTFGLSPEDGLLMLGGIYMGSHYGGAITAILLNAPGDVVAVCTAMEGNPMAKQGRAKEALYYAILACVVGGLIGVLVLIFFTPMLAKFALKFGPGQMFLIAVAGLVISAILTAKNAIKGLFGVVFGIVLSIVGFDTISGANRLTFGILQLKSGIPLIPVILGLFAITEMVTNVGKASDSISQGPSQNIRIFAVIKAMFKKLGLLLKSSALGTFIGVVPGTGGAVATFISYAEAKRTSKNPERFGNGNPEGIIAAESANNGAVGGSLVPLLALGVPGSATSAIMYGALTIHGLIPGPRLFADHADVALTFIWGMLLTVFIMGAIGILGIPLFSKIVKVKLKFIVPTVLAFCMFGAYSIRNDVFDILLAIIFGIVGLVFRKVNIPPATVVLGLILGPIAEQNFRRALIIANAKDLNIAAYMMNDYLSYLILGVVVLLLISFMKINRSAEALERKHLRAMKHAAEREEKKGKRH